MKVKPFERYLKDLLERDGSPAMVKVETFEEADLTYKPAGLKITCDDGGCTFVQFLGPPVPAARRLITRSSRSPRESWNERRT